MNKNIISIGKTFCTTDKPSIDPLPPSGSHKLRAPLPLMISLRNRLKYAQNGAKLTKIVVPRFIKVDGEVRTDLNYPDGFMNVISFEKNEELFRLIYDAKLHFTIHRISVLL